jgi:hypothetical protein
MSNEADAKKLLDGLFDPDADVGQLEQVIAFLDAMTKERDEARGNYHNCISDYNAAILERDEARAQLSRQSAESEHARELLRGVEQDRVREVNARDKAEAENAALKPQLASQTEALKVARAWFCGPWVKPVLTLGQVVEIIDAALATPAPAKSIDGLKEK